MSRRRGWTADSLRLTADGYGQRFTVYGLRSTVHGARFTDEGSRLAGSPVHQCVLNTSWSTPDASESQHRDSRGFGVVNLGLALPASSFAGLVSLPDTGYFRGHSIQLCAVKVGRGSGYSISCMILLRAFMSRRRDGQRNPTY
jgi:hypothetical protein